MERKPNGLLGVPVTFEPEIANAAMRTAPEFEQEYWVRQARAAVHREVLVAEGQTAPVPSAMSRGALINGGLYEQWLPISDCGTFATDPVSADFGTFEYDLVHLDYGVF